MAEFKVIEEGAMGDYEFEASADSLKELFKICARATFEAMTDVSLVEADKDIQIDVKAKSLEELLYAFLSELIYIKDVENIFLSKYEVGFSGKYQLNCNAWGEAIDSEKHSLRTDVKAVTYHKLAIEKTDKGYSAHVILDL
jgi:SHS2 domain-containing protein